MKPQISQIDTNNEEHLSSLVESVSIRVHLWHRALLDVQASRINTIGLQSLLRWRLLC